MSKMKIAVCQIDSQNDKWQNLQQAAKMIEENAKKGADLIAFPETMNFMGKGYRYQAEPIPGETTEFLCEQARKHHVWLVSGSFPEKTEEEKPKNTLVLISPEGEICCKYSKLHMFDIDADGKSYRESAGNTAGDEIVLADTLFGRIGFAICYDLRFGEMFRLMALHGANLVIMPSSFTYETGKKHWETLIRARAIENGMYIVAPNQIGEKTTMKAYGHSMIVDPYGAVVEVAEDKVCSIMAEIDTAEVAKARNSIPSLENRRSDVYDVTSQAVKIYQVKLENKK